MPEKLIEERFKALSATVEAASAEVVADRKERELQRQSDEKRTKWWRRLTIAAVVGSVGSIVACWFVYDLFQQFEADRASARATACREQLADRLSFNLTLLNAFGFQPDGQPTAAFRVATPEQQARARSLLLPEPLEDGTQGGLRPLRICTSDAIAAYYASGGVEGIVPIDGEDDDYSEAVTPL